MMNNAITRITKRVIREAMDQKKLNHYADAFSDILNEFDALSANFNDDYTFDETQEKIVSQIERARAEQAKLVKMLNSSKYGRV